MKSKTKFTQARSSATSIRIPTHDAIAARATAIWREKMCLEGQDTEIWLEAEDQLCAEAEKRGKIHTAPSTIFDEDRKLTHQVEKHLEEIAQPASDRSATSL